MKKLENLRNIKTEVNKMDFNYKNTHRIMYLVYRSKQLFEDSGPIPNKDIALHQTNKLIEVELMELINSDSEKEVKKAFDEVVDNFKIVLDYIA